MAYEIVLGREDADKARFGLTGTVFIGKHYVKMGQVTSLSQSVYLDLNKAHVIFVCGKRGSGKCLAGDTLITLADGRQVRIDQLSGSTADVLALSSDLKIRAAERTDFYRRKVEVLLQLKLRSGKTLKLTPEHPLLTIDGWKEAGSLGVGGRIATPRVLPTFGSYPMADHEVKLLAYMIAEGHLKYPLFFTNTDTAIVQEFTGAVKSFDSSLCVTRIAEQSYKINRRNQKRAVIDYNIVRRLDGTFGKGSSITREKSGIRKFFEKHGVFGRLSAQKEVPPAVFQLPRNKLALFLNRLFSCDGSIWHSGSWQVDFASSSITLATQVQHLILRFGVVSKLRTKLSSLKDGSPYVSYEVVVSGENVARFLQEIGFFGRKEARQAAALLSHPERNPNVDTIPKEFWNRYRPASWADLGRHWGYAHPKAARESVRYAPSRQKLLSIAEFERSDSLRSLADSDIFWDEIVSAEVLRGSFDVYDLTVPGMHNFVANDIIVHNSYCMGVIAEGIAGLPDEIRNKVTVIMLDTMGIYWTMKYPNHKEEAMLKEWGAEGAGVPVKIFTPLGFFNEYKEKKIPTDAPFAINPAEFGPDDWWLTFEMNANEPVAIFIERIILNLKSERAEFGMEDIIAAIQSDNKEEVHVKNAAENRFTAAMRWGLFHPKATPIHALAAPGQISILDLSPYAMMPGGWKIKHLVLGVVCNKLFLDRMRVRKMEEFASITKAVHYLTADDDEAPKDDMPIVWLMIDEAHEFLPNVGKTASTDALITLLREGRQPGIAMVMATQQPGKIHTDAMTQSDIILAHRLTAKLDTDALGGLMQSYMRSGLDKELNNLPRVSGAALAMDDVNERMYPMRIRPRFSWHGGGAPGVISVKKKVFEF